MDDPTAADEVVRLREKVARMKAMSERLAAALVNANAYVTNRRTRGQVTIAVQAYYEEIDRV